MDMKRSMRPLTISSQICSMHIPDSRTGPRRVINIFYCILIQMMMWGNAARFSLALMVEEGWTGSLMASLAYFVTELGINYNSLLFIYASSVHLEQSFGLFTEYQKRYGLASDLMKIRTAVRTACIWVLLSSLGQGFAAAATMTLFRNSTLGRLAYPLNKLQGGQRILSTIFLFVSNVGVCPAQILPMILFSGICFCLSKEFDYLKKMVREMIRQGKVNEKCERIRKQHLSLCEVLENANKIITHFFFSVYVSQIPAQCFILYGIIRGSLPLEEFMVALTLAIFGTIICFSATIASACLCSKAHGCLDDLLQADMTDLSPRTLQIISVFVCRLSGPPIGFTVYGLFTVDASTILTIIGTLLTYSVVVLQVKPDDSAVAQIQRTINALTNSTA